jgi:L-fucose mutarotase
MQVVGAPDEIPEVVQLADPIIKNAGANIELIERHAFYASAKQTYVVIRTTETRFYGNFILRKGVVWPK